MSQRLSLTAAPVAKRPVYAGFDRSLLPTYVISVAWSRSKSDPETALKLSRLRTSLSTSGGRR